MGRLVLERMQGQSVEVGNAIIRIDKIRTNKVKISIVAPNSVNIRRTELDDEAPSIDEPT